MDGHRFTGSADNPLWIARHTHAGMLDGVLHSPRAFSDDEAMVV
jgi:hypothetical protein